MNCSNNWIYTRRLIQLLKIESQEFILKKLLIYKSLIYLFSIILFFFKILLKSLFYLLNLTPRYITSHLLTQPMFLSPIFQKSRHIFPLISYHSNFEFEFYLSLRSKNFTFLLGIIISISLLCS